MACPCPGARLLTLLDSHGQGRNGLRQRRFRGQPARDRQDTVGEPAAVVHEATLLAGWIGKRAGGLGGNAGRWVDLEAGGRGGHGQVDRPAGRQAGRPAGGQAAGQPHRNSAIDNGWTGAVWNMAFVGTEGGPVNSSKRHSHAPFTLASKQPLIQPPVGQTRGPGYSRHTQVSDVPAGA